MNTSGSRGLPTHLPKRLLAENDDWADRKPWTTLSDSACIIWHKHEHQRVHEKDWVGMHEKDWVGHEALLADQTTPWDQQIWRPTGSKSRIVAGGSVKLTVVSGSPSACGQGLVTSQDRQGAVREGSVFDAKPRGRSSFLAGFDFRRGRRHQFNSPPLHHHVAARPTNGGPHSCSSTAV